MQSENRLFDDVARMAGGALNLLTGLKTEVETMVRGQMEAWLANLNLVTREEFEVVRQMAVKAREEQEVLAARLAALETKSTKSKSKAGSTDEKPA